jgi:autotransporter-associated beta strand protein
VLGIACLSAVLAGVPTGAQAIVFTALGPTNGTQNVCTDLVLRVTFDAAPVLGTNGLIRIYSSNSNVVDEINLALNSTNGTQPRTIGGTTYNTYPVLISSNVASIFPNPNKLAYNQTYFVTIGPGVFSGFAGLTNSSDWRFKTKSAAPAAGTRHLVVAQDGSGDFCTVQGALDFLPANNTNRTFINIRNGAYTEIVRVNAKHNVVFRGQNRRRTVITYANHDKINPGTGTRGLVAVQANDITFDRLSLSNSTPNGIAQAEALRVNGDRCIVNDCDVVSFQDTVLVNSAGDSAYFRDTRVAGSADFVWGSGTVVFDRCEIHFRAGGYLCQMRNPAGQSGAVFLDCRVTAAPGTGGSWLARIDPTNYPASAVAFVNCTMGPHITNAAWQLTGAGPTNQLRFWEYQSVDTNGVLVNTAGRAAFSRQITAPEAAALRDLTNVFAGWLPLPPVPAFPGAEGAGWRTLGGRGGDVYYVTSLADSGAGTLRDAVSTAPSAGRTILFKVDGNIELASPLSVNKPRLTIAGQSAPGDGICLKNCALRLDADNLIVRHLRSRLGTNAMQEDDALTVWGGVDVMIDHCSTSWSVDEVLSATGETDNLSVQWCHISEALDNSIHSKGAHGYGSLFASYWPASVSIHHNLYAHNQSRNPRLGSYNGERVLFDFRQNVLYNWGFFAGYTAADPEKTDINYINNYLVKGGGTTRNSAFNGGGLTTTIFQSGNKLDLNTNGVFDGTNSGWAMFTGTFVTQLTEFAVAPVVAASPEAALQRVLSQGGARPWKRDAVDLRIASNVIAGTGGFVDTTDEAGGYPVLASAPAPSDADGDGMPDFWETALGYNTSIANHNADPDGDGYTQLEDYLNWLAAPHGVTYTNTTIDFDLRTLNGGRTNGTFAVASPTNGTVSLLGDGRTARFVPVTNFDGLGQFTFTFTSAGIVVTQVVGVCVSDGFPRDIEWLGTNALWEAAGTANFRLVGTPTDFRQGDRVTFNDSGITSNITIQGAIQPGALVVNATRDYTFGGTGALTGGFELVKTNAGTLTLTNDNAFSGGIVVRGGTLALSTHADAAGTGPITLRGGTLQQVNITLANAVDSFGTNTWTPSGSANVQPNSRIAGNGRITFQVNCSGVFTPNGDWAGFTGSVVLAGSNPQFRFLGTRGSGSAAFDLGTGTGKLFNRNGDAIIELGSLTGGVGTVVSGASTSTALTTYVVGRLNTDSTFNGRIIDDAVWGESALLKIGSGSFTLTGTNTYSGATVVSNGVLRVDGWLGTGAVRVAGGTLAGRGIVRGPVTVQSGGTLEPGSGGVGRLTVSNSVTMQAGSVLRMKANRTAQTNDSLVASGGISLGGALVVTNLGGTFLAGDALHILPGTSLTGAFTTLTLPPLASGLTWRTNALATKGSLWVIETNPRPPVVQTFRITNGMASLMMSGALGYLYTVQMSSNLVSWTNLWSTNAPPMPFSWSDPAPTNLSRRFYRVVGSP